MLGCLLLLLRSSVALEYISSNAGSNGFSELVFKNRLYLPYGPDLVNGQDSEEVWEGFGFGMGAGEHFAYDPINRFVYSQSEADPGSFIAVMDLSELPGTVSEYSLDLSSINSEIKDVVVCPEQGFLFAAATDADIVVMYETVQRSAPAKPKFVKNISAGAKPDNLSVNSDCTLLAVANENDGNALAEGALHLVSDFTANGGPTIRKVRFSSMLPSLLTSHIIVVRRLRLSRSRMNTS